MYRVCKNLYIKLSRLLTSRAVVAGRVRYVKGKSGAEGSPESEESSVSPVFDGSNASYIENLFNSWMTDPLSVHPSWSNYFRNNFLQNSSDQTNIFEELDPREKDISLHLHTIIKSYQMRGHKKANLDPLKMSPVVSSEEIWGIDGFKYTEEDLNRPFQLPPTTLIGGNESVLSLGEILTRLEKCYCGNIGIEFMHIDDAKQRSWIMERFEKPESFKLSQNEKDTLLIRLVGAVGFESFLAKKYSSEKRFGAEGCEVIVPALKASMESSLPFGVESFVLGLPHRGRLNILANVCWMALKKVFQQFKSSEQVGDISGDVKYHLGAHVQLQDEATNKDFTLSVGSNPSHLEAVNPVVLGKTRAEQFYKNDPNGEKVMAILVHGDAAFCGQGLAMETMQLSRLPNYTTHGVIHYVVNNQIGFTTSPRFGKSSDYCTDVAKIINVPIFHVNADDPESVLYVSKVAAEWRNTFHKDVVVDLVGYRRNGHNEIDEPMFTQPVIYKKIKSHKNVLDLYAEKLMASGQYSKETIDKLCQQYDEVCENAFEFANNNTEIDQKGWCDCKWPNFFKETETFELTDTGVDMKTLLYIGQRFSSPPSSPPDFQIHKSLSRILAARKAMMDAQEIDWALGEAMAFGSLLKEGVHVRLSGQDVERGTFSHRHHVMHDQNTDQTYNALQHLYPEQASYTVCNSPLAEYSVLGFEHGYSLASPKSLVLWEAQFGDFCNVAQCIIDQFIASGQTKWLRQSGIVMLLPHGMEGMGPEHSSARIERFLQLSSEDPDVIPEGIGSFELMQLKKHNIIVANCTTPANLFHILRRQVALPFRKPLILMTPKSLLRHPEAKSHLSELTEEKAFQRLLPEDGPASRCPAEVKKLIFCSGKVFYDLKQLRQDLSLENEIALARLEQIAPFPFDLVKQESEKYFEAEILWVQEEHKNQGCWSFVQPRFKTALPKGRKIFYCGRPTSASTATGSKAQHIKEQQTFLADATLLNY